MNSFKKFANNKTEVKIMKELFEQASQFFQNNELTKIREFSLWFAKSVTKNILRDDKKQLEELCDESCSMRDDIEFEQEVERNKEFYFGYCYAYENIARKIFREKAIDSRVEEAVFSEDRLRQIIRFLGKNNYARQNQIAEHLGITSNNLCNFFNRPSIKILGIFSTSKIGRNVVYSLNRAGKEYYERNMDESEKLYSKKQLIELYKVAIEDSSFATAENIREQSSFLDESIAEELHDMRFSLRFNMVLGLKNKQKYSKIGATAKKEKNHTDEKLGLFSSSSQNCVKNEFELVNDKNANILLVAG